MHVEIVP